MDFKKHSRVPLREAYFTLKPLLEEREIKKQKVLPSIRDVHMTNLMLSGALGGGEKLFFFFLHVFVLSVG